MSYHYRKAGIFFTQVMHTVCYVFQKLRHFQQCSYIFTAPGDKGSKTKGTKSIQTTPRPQNDPVPPLKTVTRKNMSL